MPQIMLNIAFSTGNIKWCGHCPCNAGGFCKHYHEALETVVVGNGASDDLRLSECMRRHLPLYYKEGNDATKTSNRSASEFN